MKHLTEQQIVLHCFGDAKDGQAIDRHLEACARCRTEFEQVKTLLSQIPPAEAPEPTPYLEQKLWLNLRDQLTDERRPAWRWFSRPSTWAIAGVMAILVVGAFLAGRFWPHSSGEQPPQVTAQANPQRVVLVAVGEHLERSQMLLIEFMNSDPADATSRQQAARNLLQDNRLYRQSAQHVGDPEVARVLDELERVLVEIANAPPDANESNVLEVRKRVQSQDLLFKIHVLGTRISKTEAPGGAANQRL